MSADTNTPRTDANLIDIGHPLQSPNTVTAEFARTLERELNEKIAGEQWAAGIFCEIMVIAISGFADAVIVAQQQMGPKHALLAVIKLAECSKQFQKERDELKSALALGQINCDSEYDRLRRERDIANAKLMEAKQWIDATVENCSVFSDPPKL